MFFLAKEAIEAIKSSEKNAELMEKNAKNNALDIINKAKNESDSIIFSKEKEAKAKAELRINFSKNEAKEYLKNNLKKVEKENLKMEKTTFEKMNDARDVILKELLGM